MSAKTRVTTRLATPEDVDAIVRIHDNAFGRGIMSTLLYDGKPMSEDAKRKYGASLFPDPNTPPKPGSGELILRVAELLPEETAETDGETDKKPQVIAFSKWVLFEKPRTEEEWNSKHEFTTEMLGEGANIEVFNTFIGGLHDMRGRSMKGEPGLYLNTLAADPSFGRLGGGSALLRWGAAEGDKKGLNLWLEASVQGYPLYRRFGFEDKDVLDLDLEKLYGIRPDGTEDWGTKSAVEAFGPKPETVFRSVLMKREPQKTA